MLDFAPAPEQLQFQRAVSDLVKRRSPLNRVREVERSGAGYDADLYREMAGLGWTGLLLSAEHGGAGEDWIPALLLYEELGRALALTPHFPAIAVAGRTIARWGTDAMRRELLPGVAGGQWVLSWIAAEPGRETPLYAQISGSSCRTTGTNRAVLLGHVAHAYVVATNAGDDFALCLVEASAAGVKATALPSFGGLRLATVELRDAPASVLARGAAVEHEWRMLLLRARLLVAAEMLGGAQACLDMAVEYAKQRVAFGRPIGSFQALQHKMANMKLEIEGLHAIVYYAGASLDQGRPASAAIAAALLQAARAYRLAAVEAVQVFGGIGVMEESQISMYFRRAKALELLLGPHEALEDRIVDELADTETRERALTLFS